MINFNTIREILSKKVVGIAGAGGLGSNCASSLVRCGIGKLIIADFDVVSVQNLNRQFYFRDQTGQKKVFALRDNLTKINPDCILQVHDVKIGPNNIDLLFSKCDMVVEAFDDASGKQMLVEHMLINHPHIPLVIASGMAGWGDFEKIRKERSGNLYICGDQSTEVSEFYPPIAPRVAIVSNMQADVVVEYFINQYLKNAHTSK